MNPDQTATAITTNTSSPPLHVPSLPSHPAFPPDPHPIQPQHLHHPGSWSHSNESLTQQQLNAQAWKNTASPAFQGHIASTHDALIVFQACSSGTMPKVTRRLHERERRTITSGAVYVFDEQEAGIKRWTDGRIWSPSRILNNFLIYREIDQKRPAPGPTAPGSNSSVSTGSITDPAQPQPPPPPQLESPGPLADQQSSSTSTSSTSPPMNRDQERALVGSLTTTYKFKTDGLVKKTISIAGMHMISYYKVEDVLQGRLRSPSSHPELCNLIIADHLLQPQHFRVAPILSYGSDGRRYFHEEGEADNSGTTGGPASRSPTTVISQRINPRPHHIDTTGAVPPGLISRPTSSAGSCGTAHSPVSPNTFINRNPLSRLPASLGTAPGSQLPMRRYDPYSRPTASCRSPPTSMEYYSGSMPPPLTPTSTYEAGFLGSGAPPSTTTAEERDLPPQSQKSGGGSSFDYRDRSSTMNSGPGHTSAGYRLGSDSMFHTSRSLPSINRLQQSSSPPYLDQQDPSRLYSPYGHQPPNLVLHPPSNFVDTGGFGTYSGLTINQTQHQHQQQQHQHQHLQQQQQQQRFQFQPQQQPQQLRAQPDQQQLRQTDDLARVEPTGPRPPDWKTEEG